MIARKQEISLQLNQSIDALPGAPAALLRKERIDIAHAAMRLRRGESGECFILAGRAHKPPEFPRSVSRVMLTFSLIKLDKVRRALGPASLRASRAPRESDFAAPRIVGQRRAGFHGRPFTKVKLRTTLTGAKKPAHSGMVGRNETSGRQT